MQRTVAEIDGGPEVLALRCAEALGIALLAFAGVAWWTPLGTACTGMGLAYQQMSVDPWACVGDHPHRVLGPLLAHLLGLGGGRYWQWCHLTSIALLALVYGACRQQLAARIDAVLVVFAVAASGTIGLYTSLLVGFSDTLTFALLLATVMAVRSSRLCWALHLLNLVNHEQALFFTPLVIYLRWCRDGAGLRQQALAVAVVAVLYASFRQLISAQVANVTLSVGFYLESSHLPWGWLGLAALTTAHSVTLFGPLLVPVFWAAWQPRDRHENRLLLLVVLPIYAMLVVAYDFPRFLGFLFLPLMAGSLRMLQGRRGRVVFLALLVASVFSTRWLTEVVVPRVAVVMAQCGALVDPEKFGTCVVPKVAGLLGWLAAALGLLAVVARVLMRAVPAADRSQPPS